MINNVSTRNIAVMLLYATGLVLASTQAGAQEQEEEIEGGGFSFGLDSELRYDDNIFRAESGKVDSFIFELSPFAKGTLVNGGNSYQVSYNLNHAEHLDSSTDTFTDHEIAFEGNHRFTSRNALSGFVRHKLLTEERGTGFSEEPSRLDDAPLASGPDDYDTTSYGMTYYFGAVSAPMRIELNAEREDFSFDSSYVGDTRDYRANLLGALGRYKVGAKTDLLLEYRNLDVKYDNVPLLDGEPINLDSDEDYYLAGVAWEATAKTSGEVKVGRSERDYDDGSLSNSDFHWEVELAWRPKSYSELLLRTGRESLETYGTGRFVNVQKHSVAWNHGWSSRFASQVQLGVTEDTYEESNRVDDQMFWNLGVSYSFRSWMSIGSGLRYHENDSTFRALNYEQNIAYVNVKIQL